MTAPELACNAPATIIPPDAPVSFTAGATDSCGAVTTEVIAYDCYKFTKKGKLLQWVLGWGCGWIFRVDL